jgi:menaquinone-dependent protoporphyrinogen oxidase
VDEDRADGPRVLVAVASRHGATLELGQWVADGMRSAAQGCDVVVRRAAEVDDVAGFDAVVLGSAVYFGHWLEEARELLLRCAIALWELPVWIFSSGPLGEHPRPPEVFLDIDEVQRLTRARAHRLFPGRLEEDLLDLGERAIVAAFFVPKGDFRDPAAARAWGVEIATAVTGAAAGAEPAEP